MEQCIVPGNQLGVRLSMPRTNEVRVICIDFFPVPELSEIFSAVLYPVNYFHLCPRRTLFLKFLCRLRCFTLRRRDLMRGLLYLIDGYDVSYVMLCALSINGSYKSFGGVEVTLLCDKEYNAGRNVMTCSIMSTY